MSAVLHNDHTHGHDDHHGDGRLALWCAAPPGVQAHLVEAEGRLVTLSEVVVRSGTDVSGFIRRVRTDTTFYKAFRNLRVLNYQSMNDIRMFDRKGGVTASLHSRTRQRAWSGCRVTQTLEQSATGDFFDRKGDYTYFTARLYDGLFFSFDTVFIVRARSTIGREIAGAKRRDRRYAPRKEPSRTRLHRKRYRSMRSPRCWKEARRITVPTC